MRRGLSCTLGRPSLARTVSQRAKRQEKSRTCGLFADNDDFARVYTASSRRKLPKKINGWKKVFKQDPDSRQHLYNMAKNSKPEDRIPLSGLAVDDVEFLRSGPLLTSDWFNSEDVRQWFALIPFDVQKTQVHCVCLEEGEVDAVKDHVVTFRKLHNDNYHVLKRSKVGSVKLFKLK